jgi:hypothetical protein
VMYENFSRYEELVVKEELRNVFHPPICTMTNVALCVGHTKNDSENSLFRIPHEHTVCHSHCGSGKVTQLRRPTQTCTVMLDYEMSHPSGP